MVDFSNPILLKTFSSEWLSNTSKVTQQQRPGRIANRGCLTLTPRSPSLIPVKHPYTGPRSSLPLLPDLLPLHPPKLSGNSHLSPPGMLSRSGKVFALPWEIFHAALAAEAAPPTASPHWIGWTQGGYQEAQMTSQLAPVNALGARAPSVRACVRVSEHVRPRNVHRGRGRKQAARGGASVAIAVTSGVGERNRPLPARARAHTQRDMHTRAHRRSPWDTLEGKVKLKAREPGSRREPPQPPRAMTDANEAVFSPPTPPSRCSRRAPSPGTRASARPLPPALRARAGRSGRGSGSRSGSGSGREVGGRGGRPGGLLARPRSPSPGPSAGARQVSAVGGEGVRSGQGTRRAQPPCLTPSGGADRRAGPGLWGASRGQPVWGLLLAPPWPSGSAPGLMGARDPGECSLRAGVGWATRPWDRRREAGGPLSGAW